MFPPGQFSIESLEKRIDDFDFAILIMTCDDKVKSRGRKMLGPRDNLLFELGFFIGRLGRRRTLMVMDRSVEGKFPTDIAGITTTTYVPPNLGNYQSALGAACVQLKSVFSQLGPRVKMPTA